MNTILINIAIRAEMILSDKELTFPQKIEIVSRLFGEIELGKLEKKFKNWFLTEIVKLNQILSKYKIKDYEDYEIMTLQDKKAIINIWENIVNKTLISQFS